MSLLNTGRSSFHWWLRLIVAAFLLSAWVAVGLGSGIANADDPSPSGTNSSSENSADAPKAVKADPPKHSNTDTPDPPKHPKTGTSESTITADDTTTDTKPATVDQPSEPASEANADPNDPPKPSARSSSHRPGLTTASVSPAKPAKTVSPEPQPPAAPATSYRSALAPAPQPSTQVSAQQSAVTKLAAVANIAPSVPSVSSNQSPAIPIHLPNQQQIVGLVTDVGTVAASVVFTVADTVAKAFGPHSFLGVPYALATAVANSAAAVSRTLIGAPPGSLSTGPFTVNYGIINGLTFLSPQTPPPGANDPSITVTAEHPLPIILINGTIATQGENWGVGAPVLANAGYKVYSFNYGNVTSDPNFPIQATDDIRQSGLQLAAEVDKVLAETGAPKVILIGHSQGGGILPVYYINNLGGADKVSQLIGIAPSNHGTDADGLIGLQNLPILGPLVMALANSLGQAFEQQSLGDPFQQEVYGNGDTRPGVLYTTIASMSDEVVTPYTQQALDGPNVTNIVVQDLYPGLPVGHLGVVLSPQVWSIVLDALASNPQANPLADPLQSEVLAA
ncbi:triacylglycerol esterase/lipase EstA (alpha/beta hydrolase family) [Mycolicibacterium moriokaense]|uniref:Triacylglycerol esterase/lipase EstA (Alpha/beta hydrolase family) n=2 Tax=Mycolicibacterium moriokaense TaxID=39691 RepID=A0A318HE40_9MYCO|nr:triacylglycerol esterase/lipase EstA (alpha/beta hydrolase family) [Mycolicibacterium moriokaense]